jgi:SHS2 domain-containing protein
VPYELLDHVADARFRATGESLAAALTAAVDAFATICDTRPDRETTGTAVVTAAAHDREALLFDFLGELILLQDVDGSAVVSAAVVDVEREDGDDRGYRLEATIRVAPIDAEDPLFDVKAPTYDGTVIEERDGGWVIEATLDI